MAQDGANLTAETMTADVTDAAKTAQKPRRASRYEPVALPRWEALLWTAYWLVITLGSYERMYTITQDNLEQLADWTYITDPVLVPALEDKNIEPEWDIFSEFLVESLLCAFAVHAVTRALLDAARLPDALVRRVCSAVSTSHWRHTCSV